MVGVANLTAWQSNSLLYSTNQVGIAGWLSLRLIFSSPQIEYFSFPRVPNPVKPSGIGLKEICDGSRTSVGKVSIELVRNTRILVQLNLFGGN